MEQVTEEAFKHALTRHTAIMVEAEVGHATSRAFSQLVDFHRSQLETVKRELAEFEKRHHPKHPKTPRHLVLEMDLRLGQHVLALIQKRRDQLAQDIAAARSNLEAVRPLITNMKRELDRSIAERTSAENPSCWPDQQQGDAHR